MKVWMLVGMCVEERIMNRITISVIKADVGGYVGHSAMHPELIREASGLLEEAQKQNR
jgi:fructose 1,6-bisphosphatase